jgi:hypothetical protein
MKKQQEFRSTAGYDFPNVIKISKQGYSRKGFAVLGG